MEQIVTSRIAPTPSGFLHSGNGLNFILTYLLTRVQNGKLILRIDDLDQQRMRQEYLDDIFLSLDWLGIDWDQGPSGVTDHLKNYSQVLKLDAYQKRLQQLLPYSFACECSRKDIARLSVDGKYPGTCRHKKLDYKPTITSLRKISNKNSVTWDDLIIGNVEVNLCDEMGDFIIYKKDGKPAYQLSSLHDDLEMGSSLIVRGLDLKQSTAAQLFLAEAMGEDLFAKVNFVHHPLIRDLKGNKLSKSEGAISLKYQREHSGKEYFFRWLADLFKLERSIIGLSELLEIAKEGGIARVLGWVENIKKQAN